MRRGPNPNGKKFPTLPSTGKKYRALGRWGLLIALVGGLGMGAPTSWSDSGRARLVFRSAAVVQEAPVRLGDVAQVLAEDSALAQRLATLPVGTVLPPIGQEWLLRPGSVRLLLRRYRDRLGVDTDEVLLQGAPLVRVRRASQQIEPEELLEAVRLAIAQQLGREYGVERVELSYQRRPDPVAVPPGRWEAVPEWERAPQRLASRWTLPVTIRVQGEPVASVFLALNLHAYGTIGVAKRALRRHETLGTSDVEYVVRDLTALNGRRPLGRAMEAIGLRARRAIRAGEPLTDENVEELPLVRQGELITVTLEAPLLRLTMLGVALQDGRLGETIPIRNPVSGKVIRGVVVRQRVAQVVLPALRPNTQTAQANQEKNR